MRCPAVSRHMYTWWSVHLVNIINYFKHLIFVCSEWKHSESNLVSLVLNKEIFQRLAWSVVALHCNRIPELSLPGRCILERRQPAPAPFSSFPHQSLGASFHQVIYAFHVTRKWDHVIFVLPFSLMPSFSIITSMSVNLVAKDKFSFFAWLSDIPLCRCVCTAFSLFNDQRMDVQVVSISWRCE